MISSRVRASRCVAPVSLSLGSSSRPSFFILKTSVAVALSLLAGSALSQTAPDLGSTSPFAIVSETFSNTTAGTVVDGDVCFTTGPAVDPTVTGSVQTPCPAQTGIDQDDARAELDAQSFTPIGAAVALDPAAIFSVTFTNSMLASSGFSVPVFSQGGIALFVILMLMVVAYLQPFNLNRR